MIKVSLDKCLEVIENRFELVMLASSRAARIMSGAPTEYNESRAKHCLVALKEIEKGLVSKKELEAALLEYYADEHSNLNLRRFTVDARSKEPGVEDLFSKTLTEQPGDVSLSLPDEAPVASNESAVIEDQTITSETALEQEKEV